MDLVVIDKENKSVKKRRGPGGSRKGIPNKATANAREAIAMFCETNVPNMQRWLDEIADEQGAYMAFKCTLDLMEYYVPKLARQELVGDKEQPIIHVYKWQDD